MPTIRIHDWTKEQLEAVRSAESHSSYDSVVKALLRDRQLARTVGKDLDRTGVPEAVAGAATDKRFDDLTALAELDQAEKGILFLWCPNCGNEIAHLDMETPITVSVFETQCQQCLTELDHHALVVVEIGYPVEEKSVENALQDDLRGCILDYWDRTLANIDDGTLGDDVDLEYLVWKIFDYARSFDWEWPTEMAVMEITPGETYRNRATDELIEVVEAVDDHGTELGSYRVTVRNADAPPADATETTIEPEALTHLLCARNLYQTTY